jgi:hypothetical protein
MQDSAPTILLASCNPLHYSSDDFYAMQNGTPYCLGNVSKMRMVYGS